MELTLVFLEKSELQHRGTSLPIALFGTLNLGIRERHVPVEVFSN